MQKRNLLIIILFLFTGTIGWSAERIRQNFAEDFGHKHFAQRNRELIDQTADAEVVV